MKLKRIGLLLLAVFLFLGQKFSTLTVEASSIETAGSSALSLTGNRTLEQEDLDGYNTINLNEHTLTIKNGWLIDGKRITIEGPGNVELEGDIPEGLDGLEAYIIVGGLQECESRASLSIGSEVVVSSSQNVPVLVASTGSLSNSGSIENTAGANKNQSAILLGAQSQEESETINSGASLTLTAKSKVSSTAGTAIEVLSQGENVSISASNASISGGPYKGIGLDFAGSGKATLNNTAIEAALAILNIGGALSINNPAITSLNPSGGLLGQAGYSGPNAAIVDLLIGGTYNPSKASISLSGVGTLLEESKAPYSIMLYTLQNEDFVENTTNGNIQVDSYDLGSIVSMNSSSIQFSKPIPPNYLDDDLTIQLSSKVNEESLFVYTDQSLDDLLSSYEEDLIDSLVIYSADPETNTWNSTGINLVFNIENNPWLSFDLYTGKDTTITLPKTLSFGRLDYSFQGWAESKNGEPIETITTENASETLEPVNLYAILDYKGENAAQKPGFLEPVTTAVNKTIQNESWFESDSGINAGVKGHGPGFDEAGSITFDLENSQMDYTFTQNENGIKVAAIQNKSGEVIQSVLTIPQSLLSEQSSDSSIEISLGENSKTEDELKIVGNRTSLSSVPNLTINLPSSTDQARIDVPIQENTSTAGTVALKVDGAKLTPIAKSVVKESALSIPVTGSQDLAVADNAKYFADEESALEYAKEAASFVSARDLMTGMGEAEPKPFDFTANLSRGQFATILWRLQGSPLTEGEFPFGINPEAWNAPAARWAFQQGLMAQGSSLFNPEGNITREQLVTILWRYEHSPAAPLASLAGYSDVSLIHSTDFRMAMAWGVHLGIVGQGTGDLLMPQANATRMEIAAIFERFIEAVY